MLTKKKLATIAATGMVTVGLLVGGASYALFTDTEANSGNSFKAGTLELTQHRHDVPIEGPMFYVDNNDAGEMGTGLWAPLDSHTRAMFITNTGSLDGKVTQVSAKAKTGTDAADLANFSEQALVTIAVFEAPDGVIFDDSVYEWANKEFDKAFKRGMNGGVISQILAKVGQIAAADLIREEILSWKFDVDSSGQSIRVTDRSEERRVGKECRCKCRG